MPLEARIVLTEPRGFIEAIGSDAAITGWTYDPDQSDRSIAVHVYIDDQLDGAVTTTIPRPDVNTAFSITGVHGFHYNISDRWLDGRQHTVQVYAIDSSGNGPNPPLPMLSGSRTFNLASPVVSGLTVNLDTVTGTMSDRDATGPMLFRVLVDGGSTWRSDIFQATSSGAFSVAIPPLLSQPTHSLQLQVLNYGGGRDTYTPAVAFANPFLNTPATSDVVPIRKPGFPTDLSDNATPTNRDVYVYAERTGYTLPRPLTVSTAAPGYYIGVGTQYPQLRSIPGNPYPANSIVPAGTRVDSTYVHFDPPVNAFTFAHGTMEVATRIIGVISLDSDLAASDSTGVLGLPGVVYSASGLELLEEIGGYDSFRISADRRSVEFWIRAGGSSDDFRIITEAVPLNTPPVLNGPDVNFVDENGTEVVRMTASDTDGPAALTFSVASSTPDGSLFTIAGDGTLSFRQAPDYEAPRDADGDNGYDVDVSVSDGAATTTRRIRVVVRDVAVLGASVPQHSFIDAVTVVLEDAAKAPLLLRTGRIRLTRRDMSGSNPVAVGIGTPSIAGNVLTISFGPGGVGGNPNSTVGNGLYTLQLDTDGDDILESEWDFHRLLGDVNGDRLVDDADLDAVVRAVALGVYDFGLDTNGDGRIDRIDEVFILRSLKRPR